MHKEKQLSQHINDVYNRYADELMSKAYVVGVGIGIAHKDGESTGEPAIVVLVEKKVPQEGLDPEDRIPSVIEGILVDVQEVGTIRAQ